MKKVLALLLAAVMTLSLTACGGGNGTSGSTAAPSGSATSGGSYQTTYGDKQFDNVKITVELFDRANAPEGSTITENKWTKYAQEQMAKVGIVLEFVPVPRGDEVTKMNTMMSTGTAPTILGTYNWTYAKDFFAQGGTWDLSEFLNGENQAKNLKAYLGDNCLSLGTLADGSVYGIVARRATVASSNLFIRKDWLDKLKMDVPTTTDELYDAVSAFVKNNPDGEANVTGAIFSGVESGTTAGYRCNMSMPFSTITGSEKDLAVAEGFDFYADPGYREYMRYLNKFYNDGLMSNEFFTSTDEILQAKFVNNQLGFLERNVGFNVDILRGCLLQALKENYPDAEMVAIPQLKNNNDGTVYSVAYSEGGMSLIFPKTASAEEVEAGMTYLDWMATTDGGFVFYHGFEGEHFEYNENHVPIAKDANYNKTDKDWIRTDIFLIGNQGYFATTDEFNQAIAADNPGWEQYTMDDYNYSLSGTVIQSAAYITAPEIQTETANDFAVLKSQYYVQCINCAPDQFDKMYDEWLAQAKTAGVEDILAERAKAYDAAKGE